jgi:hypothetical protein
MIISRRGMVYGVPVWCESVEIFLWFFSKYHTQRHVIKKLPLVMQESVEVINIEQLGLTTKVWAVCSLW